MNSRGTEVPMGTGMIGKMVAENFPQQPRPQDLTAPKPQLVLTSGLQAASSRGLTVRPVIPQTTSLWHEASTVRIRPLEQYPLHSIPLRLQLKQINPR